MEAPLQKQKRFKIKDGVFTRQNRTQTLLLFRGKGKKIYSHIFLMFMIIFPPIRGRVWRSTLEGELGV